MNGNGESNDIAKKIIKKAIMAAAKPLIIGILILAIVLIALSSILNFLTVLDGTPQDSDWSNVPYAKSQYVKNISIDNDGKITTKMSIDEIWNKLEKNHSRVNQYLSNADELKKLINAELITDYLDTRPNPDDSIDWDSIYGDTSSKDIQGIIKLKRAMSDGTIVTMQYAKPEEFQGNLDRYNSRGNYEDNAAKNYLLTHFTIDKEVSTNKSDSDKTSKNGDETDNNTSTNIKYYAKVATWTSEEITVTSTDPDVESSDTKKYTMTTTKINYQDLVSGYTMPFEYLWAFLLVGQEKEFVLELADLVYNSEIEITVHDNLTTNTNTETDEYTKKTKVVTKDVNVDVSYHTAAGADDPASPTKAQGTQIKTNSKMEKPRSIEQTEDYKVVRTEITTTNSLDTCVTKANTWVVNYTKKYTHQIPNSQTTAGDNADEYEEPYPSTPDHTDNIDTAGIAETYRQEIEKDLKEKLYSNILTNITSLTSEYYYSTEGKKSTINTTQSSKYVSSPATTEEKTDKDSDEPNFVTIYRKKEHQQNASNINSAPLWLFELLEKNDSTKDSMVDLTKYLLYKATGKDYGVTEFNFEIFDAEKFNSVFQSGKRILKEYIRYWEHSSPPPTNADGTKYIIETDGAGNPTVGYGIDIENSGYKQLFIDAGYPTMIGGEVDIEFVDSLEDKKIEEVLNQVKSKTEGLNLTGYQINALASRAFNAGVSGALDTLRGLDDLDFAESYKKYWRDADDKFEEKDSNADYEHSLYTQYMSKPVTANNGQYMLGLERIRKSEWRLFQTGYYDVLAKWHSSTNQQLEEIVADFVERTNGHAWDMDGYAGDQCWDLWAKFCIDNELKFNYNTCGYRLCLWCISCI